MYAIRSYYDNSTHLLEQEIEEAAEMEEICTDEWCLAVEHTIDDLANMIYSISEPRWVTADDSEKIKNLRHRVHDLFV